MSASGVSYSSFDFLDGAIETDSESVVLLSVMGLCAEAHAQVRKGRLPARYVGITQNATEKVVGELLRKKSCPIATVVQESRSRIRKVILVYVREIPPERLRYAGAVPYEPALAVDYIALSEVGIEIEIAVVRKLEKSALVFSPAENIVFAKVEGTHLLVPSILPRMKLTSARMSDSVCFNAFCSALNWRMLSELLMTLALSTA